MSKISAISCIYLIMLSVSDCHSIDKNGLSRNVKSNCTVEGFYIYYGMHPVFRNVPLSPFFIPSKAENLDSLLSQSSNNPIVAIDVEYRPDKDLLEQMSVIDPTRFYDRWSAARLVIDQSCETLSLLYEQHKNFTEREVKSPSGSSKVHVYHMPLSSPSIELFGH